VATGKRPFQAGSSSEVLEKHTKEPPPVPRDLEPNMPVELSDLILRCLKKDPAERYASASLLLEALEALPGGMDRR
jgi:serine/threonine protein kinase